MPAQQWWVRSKGPILGPISSKRLRELADNGIIKPETPISADQLDWIPARKVRGLFDGSKQAADLPPLQTGQTRPRPTGGPADARSRNPRSTAAHTPSYPVLRIRRRFLRYEIVSIYETHLLKGIRLRRSLPITEEMCLPAGESELIRLFLSSRRIDYADVKELREETPASARKPALRTGPDARISQFTIKASSLRSLKFSITAQQAPNVRLALSSHLADRYWAGKTRAVDKISTALLVLLALIPILGWFVLAFLLPWKWFTRKRDDWKLVRDDVPTTPEPTSGSGATPSASREPFRSNTLGWTLKVLGIVYWIIIASPATDGLSEFILKHASSQAHSIWLFIWAPAPLLIYLGYQLCQRRLEASESRDPRKPILFLRPFEDDATTSLQPPGLFSALSGVRDEAMPNQWTSSFQGGRLTLGSMVWKSHPVRMIRMVLDIGVGTSEESIVRHFEAFGPVVAIGKPGERLATPGAMRTYVDDTAWQETVLSLLERSQAVVVQPGSTAGVRWELEQIRARVEPYRVLLCLVSYWRNPQAYEDFERIARESFRVELPHHVPFLDRPTFLYFDRGWNPRLQELSFKNPAMWPLTSDATDLGYTLLPFVQGMHGGEREMPRRPRQPQGIRKLLSDSAAVTLALSLTIAPILAVNLIASGAGALLTTAAGPDIPGPSPIEAPIVTNPPDPRDEIRGVSAPKVIVEGKAIPYQFSPDDNWKPVLIPPTEANTEHLFEYRGGIGKLLVKAKAGKPLSDFYSETLPSELRDLIERQVRTQIPTAEVKFLGDRWVKVNGVWWREVAFEQRYRPGLTERKRIFYYSSPEGWITLTFILPNDEHSRSAADSLFATFSAPATDLDRLVAEALTGAPSAYAGRKIPYRWSLRTAWKPTDLARELSGMGETGQKLKEVGVGTCEHSFTLGEGNFASIDARVDEGNIEFDSLDEVAKANSEETSRSLKSAMPDFRFRLDLGKSSIVTIDGRKWAEFTTLASFTKDEISGQFRMIQRVTNYQDRFVSLEARILREHPEIHRIVREALDSAKFDALEPFKPGPEGR